MANAFIAHLLNDPFSDYAEVVFFKKIIADIQIRIHIALISPAVTPQTETGTNIPALSLYLKPDLSFRVYHP
jgi:hypothetical protein